jgi:putative addiction module killer protein
MICRQIEATAEFDAWLMSLPDSVTRLRLARRIDKAARGNLGDVKPAGEGVSEMREFFGPGWRMYFIERDAILIVMPGGGSKSNQVRDIQRAIELARMFRESSP